MDFWILYYVRGLATSVLLVMSIGYGYRARSDLTLKLGSIRMLRSMETELTRAEK